MSVLQLASAIVALVVLLYALYRRFLKGPSLDGIPGPPWTSFWLGHLPELFQEEAGAADFRWQEEYGTIARIKAPFGGDMLWVSDPKALQYIYQTSGYNFPKQPERRVLSQLVGDSGLTWADGDVHKRQRKVMLPAFGAPETRAHSSVFTKHAEMLATRWHDMLDAAKEPATLNVYAQIAPATLEAIGEAAFDYKLGVHEESGSELGRAYTHLIASLFSAPSNTKLLLDGLAHYVPMEVQAFLYAHLPGKGLSKARANRAAAHRVARTLLADKSAAAADTDADMEKHARARDVMSILVRENARSEGTARLSGAEIVAQVRTIMLAGQETTATSLAWALRALALRPAAQARLRAELRAHTRSRPVAENEGEGEDEGAGKGKEKGAGAGTYLEAVVKETLRVHPAVPHTFRVAGRDDALPLSRPLALTTGAVVDTLPIPKGTRLVLSVCAYNRNKDGWGADADEFVPERWLGDERAGRGTAVGVYSNLLTFAGGIRACIGWRFALSEIQAFLAALVADFAFAPAPDTARVRRTNAVVMVPTLAGDVPGAPPSMPLRVCVAPREE